MKLNRLLLKVLAVVGAVAVVFSSEAGAVSYLEEQGMDQQLGLLDHPWRFGTSGKGDLLRNLPLEVRPGFPPYAQEPEKAQDAATHGLGTTSSSSSSSSSGGGSGR